ncbi:hypothetical protein KXV55_008234 [Aspergillus fumigatus]|nr:hypothetical protein KXX14_007633 [Aspergillus fumigatus]KAH2268453.1 hypothetical protein KXW02_002691 [Aspergillus fumigatus]KAH2482828.1 hypothetical protein KXV28_005264 [Aspergillus fumigatus]KAH3527337.1 hypothetical protein KXV55_008234 [Aspergillus fumigatus]
MSATSPTPSTNRPIKTGTAPPPPPPPPSADRASTLATVPHPPTVASRGPPGAFLVELLIYNVMIHATGDVRNGFKFEIKRSHDFRTTQNPPTKRIPLQWVDGQYFDEKAMFNNGQYKVDDVPVCRFESSVHKIKAPGKSLNATSDTASFPTFLLSVLPWNPWLLLVCFRNHIFPVL